MVSLRGQNKCLSIIFSSLDQIPKIKIFHMVASEHPKVIKGRQNLIDTNVLDSDKTAEYGSIDNDGAALDEEVESDSGEAGVSTGVTESVTEEVEELQQVVKYSSLLSYMLKHISLLIHNLLSHFLILGHG